MQSPFASPIVTYMDTPKTPGDAFVDDTTYRNRARAVSAGLCLVTNVVNAIFGVALAQKFVCMRCATQWHTDSQVVAIAFLVLAAPILSLVDGVIVYKQYFMQPKPTCRYYSSQVIEDVSLLFAVIAMGFQLTTGSDYLYVVSMAFVLLHIAYIALMKRDILLYPGRLCVLSVFFLLFVAFLFLGVLLLGNRGEMVYLSGMWTNGTINNSTAFCSSGLVNGRTDDALQMTCETQKDGCGACVRFRGDLGDDTITYGLFGESCLARAYNFTKLNVTTWSCSFWGERTFTTHNVTRHDCFDGESVALLNRSQGCSGGWNWASYP